MRFTTAAVAIFAGLAAATETVYSTEDITIISCAPTVTNCPGRHSSTTVPAVAATATSTAPAVPPVVTSSSSGSSPSGVSPVVPPVSSSSSSSPSGVSPVVPPVSPSVAPSVAPSVSPIGSFVTTASTPAASVTVIPVTTCIPTVTYSTITIQPSSTPSGVAPVAGSPSGSAIPSPAVSPISGSGSGSGSSPSPFPLSNGAASSFGSSFVAAGLAAAAALFLA